MRTYEHSRPQRGLQAPAAAAPRARQTHGSRAMHDLMRGVGNRAAVQMLKQRGTIQRLPTRRQVEAKVGAPKEHVENKVAKTWLGRKLKMKSTLVRNSTRYRPVLEKLDEFDRYNRSTDLADTPEGMDAQLSTVLDLYGEVEQAAQSYIASKEGAKADYMKQELLPGLRAERAAVVGKIAHFKKNPHIMRPKWWIITSTAVYRSLQLDDSQLTGETDQGGINKVDFFKPVGGEQGVFKQTKDVILDEHELPDSATKKEKEAAGTEYWVANDFAMLDVKDARLAERNVAMWRLDQLLGAGVIAKAELALHRKGDGTLEKGSFMVKAKGNKASSLGNSDKFVKTSEEKQNKGGGDLINLADPTLQRSLSRLQLIDALAMQVDRHPGNFFIETDQDGNVISVTGIDNDMAFGLQTGVERRVKEYPGLSKFVDKELAERILALEDKQIVAVLSDLLTPAEVQATLTRLHKLQEHLSRESTRLLEPDEWDEATSQGMLDERKAAKENGIDYNSYHGALTSRA